MATYPYQCSADSPKLAVSYSLPGLDLRLSRGKYRTIKATPNATTKSLDDDSNITQQWWQDSPLPEDND